VNKLISSDKRQALFSPADVPWQLPGFVHLLSQMASSILQVAAGAKQKSGLNDC